MLSFVADATLLIRDYITVVESLQPSKPSSESTMPSNLQAAQRRGSPLLPVLSAVVAAAASAFAGSQISGSESKAVVDKSQFHLFNPTPRDLMREMNTDRPDTTESPYTVDAGHYQVEMSFFDYNRNRADGERTETWTFGAMNLKAGLLNNVDLQVVFDAYTEERTRVSGITDTVSGFSDVTLRLKTNFWGNDGGKTAFGIMPFVKIPTGTELSNDQWEGGVILPLAISLTDRIGFGVMLEADFVHDDERGGYDVEWVHTATLGFDLTEQLGMYIEYAGVASREEEFDYQATFNAGITLSVTGDLVFDTGIRVGLNEAADDFGVFTGMSIRF
jgi:Putative MetA-pathway of phenol degradation